MRVNPPGSAEHKEWYGLSSDTEALHSELKKRKDRLPCNSVAGQKHATSGTSSGRTPLPTPCGNERKGNRTP